MEHKLIELYLAICRFYDTEAVLKHQRLSNFKPRFTDEELLTMYIFGHPQGHTTHRRIYLCCELLARVVSYIAFLSSFQPTSK